MSKTPHRTGNKTKNTKPATYDARMFEEKLDIFTLKKIPISDGYIETLAQEALNSALNNKDDLIMMGYFYERGHHRSDIWRWSQRNEKFKELIETRRKIIGAKRESGGLLQDPSKKYHRLKDNLVRFTMPFYEDEWRNREKEIAKDKIESSVPLTTRVLIEELK